MLHRIPPFPTFVLLAALAVLAAGCAPYSIGREGHHRRTRTERVVHRTPARAAVYRRVPNDARQYTRQLDRALRLNRRQEQAIERLLVDRTVALLDRTNPRLHARVYPFPRQRADSREARRWWRDTDRRIERVLDKRQRRVYRDAARGSIRHGRY